MKDNPLLILCIGVSGCGKSTLAAKIARQLECEFMEADDFHSQENKAHMASGKPLTDAMREPWINAMCEHLLELKNNGKSCVLAYSGLKRAHRDKFRQLGFNTQFILLDGSKQLITKRMQSRKGHFMPTSLLDSQFSAMELPDNESDLVAISIDQPVSKVFAEAREIISALVP